MARISSRRFSAALKWLLELDREDIGIYISGFLLVGAVIFSGYGEILTRILIFLYAGQMIYKGYRWIKPKKPTGPIYKAGINGMKGKSKLNGKKVH